MSSRMVHKMPGFKRFYNQTGFQIRRGLSFAVVWFLTLGLLAGGFARAKSLSELDREVVRLKELLSHYLTVLEEPQQKSRRSLMKRFLDGLVLYEMKDYDKASVIFLDLITNNEKSQPAQQARYYLADCFYRRREYRSAKLHYQKVVERGPSEEHYQSSLQRLLDLSLRTGDHSRIHKLIERIEAIPKSRRDSSMEYVLGKYYYSRGLMDRALKVFGSIPISSEYGDQAQYFSGVIKIKSKDLKEAEKIFDEGLKRLEGRASKEKPLKGKDARLRDLYVMALARLEYHEDNPDGAIEYYKKISRRSEQFEHALYELAWAYLKAWEFYRAIKSLELLALANPDSEHVAESRILVGNLKILAKQFGDARKLFKQTADEYRPIYHKVRLLHKENWSAEKFVRLLTDQVTDALDTNVRIPEKTITAMKRQPNIKRAIITLEDMEAVRKSIKQSERMIKRVEQKIGETGSIAAFPQLARARARASEVETQLAKLQAEISAKLKKSVRSAVNQQEQAELNRLEDERRKLREIIDEMPSTSEDFEQRVRKIRKLYDAREKNLHKLTVAIQGLQAQLVAIKSYFSSTAGTQKLEPEVVQKKIRALTKEIEELQAEARAIRSRVADGRSSAGMDDETLAHERRVRSRYKRLLEEQKKIVSNAKARMDAGGRSDVARIEAVMSRADSVRDNLKKYNERIDKNLAHKLGRTLRVLAEEKKNVEEYRALLDSYRPEGEEVVGGVAQENLYGITQNLYDLLIKADVGILDVSWAIKNVQSTKWAQFTVEQSKKLQALERRFEEVRGR